MREREGERERERGRERERESVFGYCLMCGEGGRESVKFNSTEKKCVHEREKEREGERERTRLLNYVKGLL